MNPDQQYLITINYSIRNELNGQILLQDLCEMVHTTI